MDLRTRSATLLSVLFFGMAFSGCTPSYLKDSRNESGATPVEFERIVEFDRDVYFLSQQGPGTVVPAGGYSVEAVQDGLRLKSIDNEEGEAVIVLAEPGTHDRSVEAPEPLSMSGGDDQHVVMLLLPEGKALQAVGSYSGVFSRHPHPPKLKPGFLSGVKLPKINSILATPPPPAYGLPPPGNITPFGTLYIKGELFGPAQGKVMMHVQVPVDKHFHVAPGTVSKTGTKAGTREVQLEVEKWSPDRITAKIPLVTGVPDHKAVLQILNAQGIGSPGFMVPFYAMRVRVMLQYKENVTKIRCSNGANRSECLGETVMDHNLAGVCFYGGPHVTDKTISAHHLNCDDAFDFDSGADTYTIELKNGWVIDQVRWGWRPSSTSEKLKLPSAETLSQRYRGASKMVLTVPWEVSPGPDWLAYWIDVDVKGPAGILYGDRVYWKK